MEPKQVAKKLQQIVEKFTTITVGYDNGLNTQDQVKKRAASSIAVLTTLVEVHNIAVQNVVDDFLSLLRLDFDNKEEYDSKTNSICSRLYALITANQE